MALPRPVAITPPLRRPRARISPAEWRWLALVGGILLLATVPPIVIAALQVPAGEVFPGYVVIARDAYVYQALWHAGQFQAFQNRLQVLIAVLVHDTSPSRQS